MRMFALKNSLIDSIAHYGTVSKSDCLLQAIKSADFATWHVPKFYRNLSGEALTPTKEDVYFVSNLPRIFAIIKVLIDEFQFHENYKFTLDACTLLSHASAMWRLNAIINYSQPITQQLNTSSLDANASHKTHKGNPKLPTILVDLANLLSLCGFDVSMSLHIKINKEQNDEINKVRNELSYTEANYNRIFSHVMTVSNLKPYIYDDESYWCTMIRLIEFYRARIAELKIPYLTPLETINYYIYSDLRTAYYDEQCQLYIKSLSDEVAYVIR